MTSARIGMPAQYEMLASFSPTVFSHSPPASFDYSVSDRLYDPTHSLFRASHHLNSVRAAAAAAATAVTANKPALHHTASSPQFNHHNRPQLPLSSIQRSKMPTAPKRSCLAVRCTSPDEAVDHSDVAAATSAPTSPTSPTYGKKHVVFADDKGYSLTEIRIMSEPSGVPPLWSLEFLAHVTQGMISPVPVEQWTVSFRQPASDYLDFRQRLDGQNVSLENVIVKEADTVVVGTVKVRNLSFHKEVIVRTSADGWKTHEDTVCTYSTIGGASGAYVLYDTFSFKLTLPLDSRKLEFCVCFRCNDTEYWDNNNNINYAITKRSSGSGSADFAESPGSRRSGDQSSATSAPISISNPAAKSGQWSEFASWNYENAGPYW